MSLNNFDFLLDLKDVLDQRFSSTTASPQNLNSENHEIQASQSYFKDEYKVQEQLSSTLMPLTHYYANLESN